MIYTHVSNKAINRIQSPLDRMFGNQAIKTDNKNDKKVFNLVPLYSIGKHIGRLTQHCEMRKKIIIISSVFVFFDSNSFRFI